MVESPSSNWSHHRRHTACWDVVLHRKTTNIIRNRRSLTISAITRRKDPLPSFSLEEKGGKRRVAKMMEEIDRFQVPSAVQEAEMQAEMQPLVSLEQSGNDRRRLICLPCSIKNDITTAHTCVAFEALSFID